MKHSLREHHDTQVSVMSALGKDFNNVRVIGGLKSDIVQNPQMVLIGRKQVWITE